MPKNKNKGFRPRGRSLGLHSPGTEAGDIEPFVGSLARKRKSFFASLATLANKKRPFFIIPAALSLIILISITIVGVFANSGLVKTDAIRDWVYNKFGTSADVEPLTQPELNWLSVDAKSFNDDIQKYILPKSDSVEAMVEIIPGKSNFDKQEEERIKREEEERKRKEEEERKKRLAAMAADGAGLCSETSMRYIEIDLSSQRLALCNAGVNEGTYAISSGSRTYPTPTGSYKVNFKTLRAYSLKYNLYMPYWMSFIGNSYGIHELPEYPNGYKEGANLLGKAVSHGCVRLGVGPAAFVYGWSPVGTPVIVHN